MQYIETSASSNMNVDVFFYTVALKAYETDQQAQQEQNQDELFKNLNGGFVPAPTSVQLETTRSFKRQRCKC
jgi:hypothetical protein